MVFLPEIADLAALSDAALIDAVGGWTRAENMASARRTRLASAAEREWWWIDPDAAVAPELAAALNVSTGLALHQTHRGVALRDRLRPICHVYR